MYISSSLVCFVKTKDPSADESFVFVASEGFEPPKAEPADLQSDPFGRLGN
jgi:hypothetical protein